MPRVIRSSSRNENSKKMHKKVLLYRPRYRKNPLGPPYSLLIVAGPLLRRGFDVRIYDSNVDDNAKEKLVNDSCDALCVGVTCLSGPDILDCIDMCKGVRAKNSEVPLVWGGYHPSLYPEQTAESEYVDIVVKGEGISTFLELVDTLNRHGKLSKIKGISYKSDGKIYHNPGRKPSGIRSAGAYPFALVDIPSYFYSEELGEKTIGYLSSIGCPYNCRFCSDRALYKGKRSCLNAERVLNDLSILIEEHGSEAINFLDTNLLMDWKRVEAICRGIISRGWIVRMQAYERADNFLRMPDDLMALLKKAGFRLFRIGAESGSQRLVNKIKDGLNVEDLPRVAKRAKEFGFEIDWLFLAGVPGESSEDLHKTFRMADRLSRIHPDCFLSFNFYSPFPGSRLFQELIKDQTIIPPSTLKEWGSWPLNDIESLSDESRSLMDRDNLRDLRMFSYLQKYLLKNREFPDLLRESRFSFMVHVMHMVVRLRTFFSFYRFPVERRLIETFDELLPKKRLS